MVGIVIDTQVACNPHSVFAVALAGDSHMDSLILGVNVLVRIWCCWPCGLATTCEVPHNEVAQPPFVCT